MVKAVNTVTGVFGDKGGGKTTTLTLLIRMEKFLCPHKPIYSNYPFTFPFKWLHGKDLIDISDKLLSAIIGINELHEYADSRNSGSLQNKRVSDFFLQSRKTNSNIYYDTQFKDQIDKRIRRITDIDVVSQNLYIDSDGDGDDDLFMLTVYDRHIMSFPQKLIYYAQPVFNMFDSSKRINPFILSKAEAKKWSEKYSGDDFDN